MRGSFTSKVWVFQIVSSLIILPILEIHAVSKAYGGSFLPETEWYHRIGYMLVAIGCALKLIELFIKIREGSFGRFYGIEKVIAQFLLFAIVNITIVVLNYAFHFKDWNEGQLCLAMFDGIVWGVMVMIFLAIINRRRNVKASDRKE